MFSHKIIIYLFLITTFINLSLFVFLLIKKIIDNGMNKKIAKLRREYEEKIERYIITKDIRIFPPRGLHTELFYEVVMDFSSFLDGDIKYELISLIKKEKLIKRIKRNIISRNPWKKRVGVFEAGKYKIEEFIPRLLELLKTDDRELVYITCKSLIEIGGKKYLWDIVTRGSKGTIINKNNILTLIEFVEEDISDVLQRMMEENNAYLNGVALEVYGSRQYIEGNLWFSKMFFHPLKEVRISALKGATSLGYGYDINHLKNAMTLKDDPEWEVRVFLAKFLKNIKGAEIIQTLTEMMRDPNWFVRHNAGMSLLKHGETGIKTLLNILDSEDKFAKDKAWELIQREVYFNQLLNEINDEDLKKRVEVTLNHAG